MKRITILLVEDNRVVRKSYRALLELETDLAVVGETSNGREAVRLVKQLGPEVVLMDIAMPVLNGLQSLRQILAAAPATKVLMLSSHKDEAYVEESMNAGAMGYLIKQTAANCVVQAIREVQKGRIYCSPLVAKCVPQSKLRRSVSARGQP
jgi:DNA-binding NarL/FixJ family response regulator